jgi:hypothetical protein
MTIPEKLTVRLGDLRQPLEAWCDEHQQNPSEAVRLAVAAMLGVDAPEMTVGNPTIADQAIAANQARWKPNRKKRSGRRKE